MSSYHQTGLVFNFIWCCINLLYVLSCLLPCQIFYITKGSLKTANKQYSSVKNDYEMYLNSDTIVEPVRM